MHIPVLDIEVEEAVEPTLALSRTGFDDIGPFVFKIAPLVRSWRCPIRLWVLPRETLESRMVSSAYFTSHRLLWWFENLVHSSHNELYHGLGFILFVPVCLTT